MPQCFLSYWEQNCTYEKKTTEKLMKWHNGAKAYLGNMAQSDGSGSVQCQTRLKRTSH